MAKRPIRYIQKPKTTKANNAAVVQNANVAPVAPPTREDEAKAREAYMQKAVDLFKSKSDKYALQRQAEKNIANQKSYANSRTPEQKASDAADIRAGNQRTLINNNSIPRSTLPQYRKQIWESARMTESDFQKQSLNAKNLERAKKGLPPLTGSYSKSNDTRSGLAYNETNPFQKKWEQSQQYRDFQSAKGPINPTGEIQRVDKYGKPLGSVLWKNGQFVGTTKEDIIKASQDPSFERAANIAAQSAKAQVSANKNREIQDFNKRVAMQGLSSKAMEALTSNVRASAESKANAQNLEIEQAARDQIREARDNFIKEQEKEMAKNDKNKKTPKQIRLEKEENALQQKIDQKVQEEGLDPLTARKLVEHELNAVGKDPQLSDNLSVAQNLIKTGKLDPKNAVETIASMGGVGGDMGRVEKVMKGLRIPQGSIDEQIGRMQMEKYGFNEDEVRKAKGSRRIDGLIEKRINGEDLDIYELRQLQDWQSDPKNIDDLIYKENTIKYRDTMTPQEISVMSMRQYNQMKDSAKIKKSKSAKKTSDMPRSVSKLVDIMNGYGDLDKAYDSLSEDTYSGYTTSQLDKAYAIAKGTPIKETKQTEPTIPVKKPEESKIKVLPPDQSYDKSFFEKGKEFLFGKDKPAGISGTKDEGPTKDNQKKDAATMADEAINKYF